MTEGTRRWLPALPQLRPGHFRARRGASFFPLDAGGVVRTTFQGRYAVYWAVRSLLRPGDEVLVPSYHHGVEVEAVLAAGAAVQFYRVDAAMASDPDDIARRIGPRTRIVLLIHHNGLPAEPGEVARLCRSRGVALIEDCAPALFSRKGERPLGSFGDAACYSLHKVLPVPDGGLLYLAPGREREAALLPPGRLPRLHWTALHVAGMLLGSRAAPEGGEAAPTADGGNGGREVGSKGRGRSPGRDLRQTILAGGRAVASLLGVRPPAIATAHFDPAFLRESASAVTRALLARFDPEGIIASRRRNYESLARALQGVARRPPFPSGGTLPRPLPEGASPLFYPLVVEDKDLALRRLRERGIQAVDLWRHAHPACPVDEFPEARWLREHVVELPIHQDLEPEDIVEVAAAALEAVRHG